MMFGGFTLTCRSFAAGTWDHGTFVNGEATGFTIPAGVQQPTPDDLELLDEGKRTRKTIVVFTTTQLNLATKEKNSDQIYFENEWYEVNVFKSFRTMFPGEYKAICTKIEDPDDLE